MLGDVDKSDVQELMIMIMITWQKPSLISLLLPPDDVGDEDDDEGGGELVILIW